MAMRRPGPVRWLSYQFGGRLPEEYREWVLHDATCRTWIARVAVRALVRIAPVFAVLLTGFGLLGGSYSVGFGALTLGLLVVLRIAVTGAAESVDARLVRHGFPPGYGSAVRTRMDEQAAERYRATWRDERS